MSTKEILGLVVRAAVWVVCKVFGIPKREEVKDE